MPWARLKELGLGFLGWPPSEFWNCTWDEFQAALRGLKRFHGGDDDPTEPMSYDELTDLIAQYPDT